MPNLRKLTLEGPCGEKNMKKLSSLTSLIAVSMADNSKLTNLGLRLLTSGQAKLSSLCLIRCDLISDMALRHLADVPTLEELVVNECPVSACGLAFLAEHDSQVRRLDLTRCWYVMDDGMQYLVMLAKLQQLTVKETSVTKAGLDMVPREILEEDSLDLEEGCHYESLDDHENRLAKIKMTSYTWEDNVDPV